MRICLSNIVINLTRGSTSDADGTSTSVPRHKPGQTVDCDSGRYIYMQANGAVAEGYICKFAEGTWDADTVTHTEGDTVQYALGVCVTSGGLADNQWGWFWRGLGYEYVYVKSSALADINMLLCTTAGQVDDSTDGTDVIHDLFTIGAAAGAALSLCRSGVLLSVNTSITN